MPEYPTQFPEGIRQQYSIKATLENRQVQNDLSGEQETRQVFIIDDPGLGMDEDIIKKYFLQIGRSFYITNEFRKKFQFHPTSRFGVGFLSVFAVSDFIEIETFKSESADGPLHLTLTGPRNYLLIQKGERTNSGTRITVHLRNNFLPGKITDLIKDWCRRVEFAIVVNDLGSKATILTERPEDFIYEMPLVTDPSAKFVFRSFPINRPGIEGELYVFAMIYDQRESWTELSWAKNQYPQMHPNAQRPELPDQIICINGIKLLNKEESYHYLEYYDSRGKNAFQLDIRKPLDQINLSRNSFRGIKELITPEIESRWEEILTKHLSETPMAYGTSALEI